MSMPLQISVPNGFFSLPPIVQQPIQVKPLLVFPDGITRMVFSDDRIHVEQNNVESDTYTAFLNLSDKLFETIFEITELTVNRLAVNGVLECSDDKTMDFLFRETFKSSSKYCSSPKEWNVAITSETTSEALNCQVNKMTTYQRMRLPDNSCKILMMYDYNTFIDINKQFIKSDLTAFTKEAVEFRFLFSGD